MKQSSFIVLIVLVALLILGSGSGIAQVSSLPVVAELPVSINDSIVAISVPQADWLSLQQYRYKREVMVKEIFIEEYQLCDSIVQLQNSTIHNLNTINAERFNAMSAQEDRIKQMNNDIKGLSGQVAAERRKRKWAWLGGGLSGVGAGIIIGIFL